MTTSNDRRHFLRSVFNAPVRLRLGERSSQAFLHDVSLKGALVEVSASWGGSVGDACLLRLVLAPDVVITMETTVAHIDEGNLVGLRCERLDLDSMTHLRQLVEHNAEDPDLLERDLATLVAQGRAAA
ncbi:MAG: PilZ domain-containing protein [Hylemonella sp.]|nr:PilZ domain-containing protein [Hylemonella sp.]